MDYPEPEVRLVLSEFRNEWEKKEYNRLKQAVQDATGKGKKFKLAVEARKLCSTWYVLNNIPMPTSTKMSMVLEVIDEMRASDPSSTIVIFCHSIDDINNLQNAFNWRKFGGEHLTVASIIGNHDKSKRAETMRTCELGTVDILLCSIRACAEGCNFQGFSWRIIIMTPDFNPNIDYQACSRVLRMGQKRTTHIVRLAIKGTIEDNVISHLQTKKLDLINTLVGTTTELTALYPNGKMPAPTQSVLASLI